MNNHKLNRWSLKKALIYLDRLPILSRIKDSLNNLSLLCLKYKNNRRIHFQHQIKMGRVLRFLIYQFKKKLLLNNQNSWSSWKIVVLKHQLQFSRMFSAKLPKLQKKNKTRKVHLQQLLIKFQNKSHLYLAMHHQMVKLIKMYHQNQCLVI